jgi:hypothetical protein
MSMMDATFEFKFATKPRVYPVTRTTVYVGRRRMTPEV